MKMYVLIHESGSYSDFGYVIHGVFSTPEKAKECTAMHEKQPHAWINNRAVVDDSFYLQEWKIEQFDIDDTTGAP